MEPRTTTLAIIHVLRRVVLSAIAVRLLDIFYLDVSSGNHGSTRTDRVLALIDYVESGTCRRHKKSAEWLALTILPEAHGAPIDVQRATRGTLGACWTETFPTRNGLAAEPWLSVTSPVGRVTYSAWMVLIEKMVCLHKSAPRSSFFGYCGTAVRPLEIID